MVSGTQKRELEKQFQKALAAIMDKLGDNGIVKTNFADHLNVSLMVAGDGAALSYDYFKPNNETMERRAGELAHQTGNQQEAIKRKLETAANPYLFFVGSQLFDEFIITLSRTPSFKIERYIPDLPVDLSSADTGEVYLKAKTLEELAGGFNHMLVELGLYKKGEMEITLPPEQDKTPGRT